MILAKSYKIFTVSVLACELLSVGLIALPAQAQEGEPLLDEQGSNAAFFRPSPAAAVGRAIRIQQLAIREESQRKRLRPEERELRELPEVPVPAIGLRREQSDDGVIVLTNQKSPTVIEKPLGRERVHKLELQRVIEESSVVVPLQPMPGMAAVAKRRPDPSDDDTGLDIALAALVAIGLAFLGISAWQKSQQP